MDNKIKDLNDIEFDIEVIEVDNSQGIPATAASGGSNGSCSTCGSSSSSTCSSSCA